MAIHNHKRIKVVSEAEHLYEHGLDEFSYSHPALPSTVLDAKEAMDYVFNVLYPRIQSSVANVAALPPAGNIIGDQRVVQDDGDGKAAMYMWSQMEDQAQSAPQWNKIADIDWGLNSVIQALTDQTQYLYVMKFGTRDQNPVTGSPFAADLDGQHIYGGSDVNQHLTLHANNGDDIDLYTGYIQVDDSIRPTRDLTDDDKVDIGTAARRFSTGYFGTLVVGTASMTITSSALTGSIIDSSGEITFGANNLATLGNTSAAIVTGTTSVNGGDITISNGSIVSSSGAIDFDNANLSTSGTLASGVHTISSTLVIGSGSIIDSGGAITFGANNLTTTGTLFAGATTVTQLNVDLVTIDNNTISTSAGALTIAPTGDLNVQSNTTIGSNNITGIAGSVITADQFNTVGGLNLSGDTIDSTTGEIQFADSLIPTVATLDIGEATAGLRNLYMVSTGSFVQDTSGQAVSLATLITFRNASAGLGALQAGHSLFWSGSEWLASNPDDEIDHGELNAASLLDDDHSQYALLAGRGATSQILHGGLTSGVLDLRCNAATDEGVIVAVAGLEPNPVSGSYDLGSALNPFDDLYIFGEMKGARLENADLATINGDVNALTKGRIWHNTDDDFIYIDTGGASKKIGHNTINLVLNQTTLVQGAGHEVAGALFSMADARYAIWQAIDVTNGEEIMGLKITKSATHVFVFADIALPAGSYRLIGMEL